MTDIDINGVKDSLKYRVPRGAQKIVTRVAKRLSDMPRTAGTTSSYIANAQSDQLAS